jgi:hypothetical protein
MIKRNSRMKLIKQIMKLKGKKGGNGRKRIKKKIKKKEREEVNC